MSVSAKNADALARRLSIREGKEPTPSTLPELMALPSYSGFFDVCLDGIGQFAMLLCDRDDGIALRCFWQGVYEPATTTIFAALSATVPRIIDAGAHTGYFSLVAAAVNPSANIIAVEPHDLNMARLLTHVRVNGINNVRISTCALSDHDGVAKLRVDAPVGYQSSGGRLVETCDVGHQVQTVRLDRLLLTDTEPVGLLKCDVEGHERSVLAGAADILDRDRPHLILECVVDDDHTPFMAMLSDLGYRYYEIDEKERTIQAVDQLAPHFDANGYASETRRNRLATCLQPEALRKLLDNRVHVA